MIAIVNVSEKVKRDGPHEYEVRINSKPLFRFTHNREHNLTQLFLKAAEAAEKYETQKQQDREMMWRMNGWL